MNNTAYKIYSAEEKQIFTDAFIHQADGGRKKYESFITNFYKNLPLPPKDIPYLDSNHPYKGMVKPGVEFNSHHMLWDTNTKDNLITYFLSQPNFAVNNKSLHRLNFVHPNWNHQNNKGECPAHLLAQRGEIYCLFKVLKDFKLDKNLKDKNDKYFTHYLFNTPYVDINEEPNFNTFVKFFTKFKMIEELIDNNPSHFQVSTPRLDKMLEEWEKTCDKVQELYTKNTDSKLLLHGFEILLDKQKDITDKLNKFRLLKNLQYTLPEKKTLNTKIKI